MFFTLQKFIWYLAMPPAILILLMLAGLLIGRWHRKTGNALFLGGVALVYLLSLEPVANELLRPLENTSPPLRQMPERVDAVVVPGGGSMDLTWLGSSPVPNAESWTRLVKGIEIAKRLKAPLLLTGGNGEPFATALSDADVMAAAAFRLGMPREQVIVENVSRNTLENAHAVRKIIKGNRIVLVTSAYHMERAALMFRRRGFTVYPAPAYPLVQSRKMGFVALIPAAGNQYRSSVALAEWMSHVWWRVRGEM